MEISKVFENFEKSKKTRENTHNVVIKSVKSEQFQTLFRKVAAPQKEHKDSLKAIKNPVHRLEILKLLTSL